MKILYVVLRNVKVSEDHRMRVRLACDGLNPDNISPQPTLVVTNDNIVYGVSNPGPSFKHDGGNVLIGQLFTNLANWDFNNIDKLDGNYALFRSEVLKVKIFTDVLGTRTVWYYKDEDVFIASTSQRAVIRYLGKFNFNEKVIPWVLSNGLLGPDLSWDKRIKIIPPDSILDLDLINWTLITNSRPICFASNNNSDKKNREILKEIIESNFSDLNLDYRYWTLTLSGGYDSRANLCLLRKKDLNAEKLKSITWGLKNSEKKLNTDAQIAQELAQQFGVPHRYFNTDIDKEEFEKIFDRFFKNGEGRIDHIAGYIDGFAIWKKLYEEGITGTIRGDEAFGSNNFISEFHMKRFMGLSLLSDYRNLEKIEYIRTLKQSYPSRFYKKNEESSENWRDRLYQSYLVPIYLSALSDLKYPYVEQINPLLSKKIIYFTRKMPKHLRTDKKAFKKIVRSYGNRIPIAKNRSITSAKDFLKEEKVVEIISKEFESPKVKNLFPLEFLNEIKSEINMKKRKTTSNNAFSRIKALIPKKIKRKILRQTFTGSDMDFNILAFRIFLIIRMVDILEKETGIKI